MNESLGGGELSLRQLAHFVAVAEEGTISGAAERLYMSQSALSGSITKLERALGADLLVRRRAQGVSITPVGVMILERAKRLLGDTAELAYLARGDGRDLVGPLVVGCFVTLAPTVLPNIRHRTHSHELTRSIVARGRSYAILVQRPPNKLSYEGLPILEKEVEPPLPACPVILAWPRARRPSPRVHALIELASRQYGGA